MFIDEDAGGGAAAEGFEADCAGAGEEIEHAGVCNPFPKDGKDRLADEVGGGSGDGRGDFDGDAPGFSSDDSHEWGARW